MGLLDDHAAARRRLYWPTNLWSVCSNLNHSVLVRTRKLSLIIKWSSGMFLHNTYCLSSILIPHSQIHYFIYYLILQKNAKAMPTLCKRSYHVLPTGGLENTRRTRFSYEI